MTIIFVPVILGTQLFRGIEHTSFVHGLEVSTNSVWSLYAFLLTACIAISYGFIQAAGNLSFGKLKNGAVKKPDLFTHAIIPLAFAFEFVYQLNPLLTRLGSFFPVLGRQFGINLDFLNISASAGIVKFWQIVFLLGGMALSYLFLHILIRKHQEKTSGSLILTPIKWLSILFLGSIYIWIFMAS